MQIAAEFLRSVTLLQDLDDPALAVVAGLLVERKAPAGAVIFRERDESDALYLVEAGEVVISKHVQDSLDVVLTTFRKSDFFGEMGLFDAGPRSATAQTRGGSLL